MSVETGLAELASATAWQRDYVDTCVDCGIDANASPGVSLWTQQVVIGRKVHERKVCERCLKRRMVEG